jgi:hypothetical protein
VLFVVVGGLLVGGLLLFQAARGWFATGGPPTAVIVDQLSLTFPNPEFAAEARETLEEAGYEVDYFPGERVTVDFYRELPSQGYDVVVMRAHSGQFWREDEEGEVKKRDYVSVFTGEPYTSRKYVAEQRRRDVVKAYYYEGSDALFAAAAGFFEESMEGDFGGALVVLMGCEGLASERTARAFLDHGAGAVVGWDREVSAEHTDAGTEALLRGVVAGEPVKEAVAAARAEVGPDPAFGAELRAVER